MSAYVMSPRTVVGGARPRSGGTTRRRDHWWRRVRPRVLLAGALAGCGLVLLPWIVVLGVTLPGAAVVTHWSAAWIGLDVAEAVGLITTGFLYRAGDRRHGLTAAATAMVLVVDAWFDTVTAGSVRELVTALGMAVGAELPLAIVCGVVALRSLRPADGGI